jgi:hypothetical protein
MSKLTSSTWTVSRTKWVSDALDPVTFTEKVPAIKLLQVRAEVV